MILMNVVLLIVSIIAVYSSILAKQRLKVNRKLYRSIQEYDASLQVMHSSRQSLMHSVNDYMRTHNELLLKYTKLQERSIKDRKMYQDLRDMYINLCGHLALQYISAAQTRAYTKLNNELDGPHTGALGDAIHTLLILHSTHKTERLLQKFKKTA